MTQTVQRKSDNQITGAFEQVDSPDTARWIGDIVDGQFDPPLTPDIPQKLSNWKKWTDKDMEKILRAIVTKVSTL